MKLAKMEGKDREAQPGLTGKCRDCGHAMVAKCGQHRVWHWAHLKSKDCDPWWEQETEWHRSWKNQFPAAWQEIGHTAQSGERHRADVKTERGLVLEFQYSALSETERVSREEFTPGWFGSFTPTGVSVTERNSLLRFLVRYASHRDCKPSRSTETTALSCAIGERAASRSISTSARLSKATALFGDYIRLAAACWLTCRQLSGRSSSRLIARELTSKRCSIRSSRATVRLPLPKPYAGNRFRVFTGIQYEECDASKRPRCKPDQRTVRPASGNFGLAKLMVKRAVFIHRARVFIP